MSDKADKRNLTAGLLLTCLGIDRRTQAFRYLSGALNMALVGATPGPELWLALGERYGKRPETVRNACSSCIRAAYEKDSENFCEILDELYFTPPRLREFLIIAAKWLRQRQPSM